MNCFVIGDKPGVFFCFVFLQEGTSKFATLELNPKRAQRRHQQQRDLVRRGNYPRYLVLQGTYPRVHTQHRGHLLKTAA